ncbi:MAG: TRAM domain-containing protein, partial [Actinomycetota bacterium]|nr:TRAM domain-containing protein [Actinomycetota bacterium]
LHLPVQSGSDSVLAAMNRHYTKDSYLALVDRLYAAMPDLALSTDIIVGFPGETERDFLDTLDVVSAARYDQSFTFIYSPREGTPAATMDCQIPREVSQERFDRLVEAVHSGVLDKNLHLVGTEQRVLFEGTSKRDSAMLTGRTDGNKVVHAPVPDGHSALQYTGAFAHVDIEEAQTWFLTGRITGTY